MDGKVTMKCGHTANAERNGKPYCVICGCDEVQEEKPNLDGRKAKCSWCGKITDSSTTLAFFRHKPESEYDEYYCGCYGWD